MSNITLSQKEILALNHAGLYEPLELTDLLPFDLPMPNYLLLKE